MAHYTRKLEVQRQPFYPPLTSTQLHDRAVLSHHFSSASSSSQIGNGKPTRTLPPTPLSTSLSSASFLSTEHAGSAGQLRLYYPARDTVKLRGRTRPGGVCFNRSGSRLLVASKDSVLLLHTFNVTCERQIKSPGASLVLPHGDHPDVLAVAGQESHKQPPYVRIFDVRVPTSGKAGANASRDTPILEFCGKCAEPWSTGSWSGSAGGQIVCVDGRDVLHVFDLPATVRTPQRTGVSVSAHQIVGQPRTSPASLSPLNPSGSPDKRGASGTNGKGAEKSSAATTNSNGKSVALETTSDRSSKATAPLGTTSLSSISKPRSASASRQLHGGANVCLFDATGEQLLVGQGDGNVSVYPAESLSVRESRPFVLESLHPGGVTALTSDPTGTLVGSGGNDHVVNLLTADSLTVVGSLGRTEGSVQTLGFSHDGRLIGWGCKDQTTALSRGGTGRSEAGTPRESDGASGERTESLLTIAGTDPCEIYLQCPMPAPVSALAFHPSRYICAFVTETDGGQTQQSGQSTGAARGTGATYWCKQISAQAHQPLGIFTLE
ncbi:wd g-beta repeat protein [Cystoisospora suis]|uniref:Wd g-beta repeat protein n=1 Tax=Cystoisospora suis TaxID=483139 RepID=A0A2C6KWG7_9APIC|nr:wd g-beta repeat protein [Cystoisospora suis]